MNTLLKQLLEIETKIEQQELVNKDISSSSVGWHIEHTLLVINRIIDSLQKSNPDEYKWEFNFWRLVIFNTKIIPRGRARSPKGVMPKKYSHDSLKLHLQEVREKIRLLHDMSSGKFFKHPYFGKLSLKNAKVFMEIHTDHHLKIINDIIIS